MCTLNDIGRKMMPRGQLENDSSNDLPTHNNPDDEDDTWESPPELSLACATTHTKLAIIDVNGDASWTEIESEESENEEFGDLEKPQGHRKRRSQQPLFNDRPKRARHVTPEATPDATPKATPERRYFNLKSIRLQNQKDQKKQEIHWSTRGRCWLNQATRKLTGDSDSDRTDGGSDTEELLDDQLAPTTPTPIRKRKKQSTPEPIRSKRTRAGKRRA
ncbi:hypothetical protein AUP68_09199 [Ilyonectria robusta]